MTHAPHTPPSGRFQLSPGLLSFLGFRLGSLGLAIRPLELLVELVDAAGRIHELHGTGEERVALRADFDRDLGLGASCRKAITTAASYLAFLVLRMNCVFHGTCRYLSKRDGDP